MNIGRCVMAWSGKGGVPSSFLPREWAPSPSRGGLGWGWVSAPTCADSNASYQIGKIGRAHVELQSLMRISYAVFCLKKKNKTNIHKISKEYAKSTLNHKTRE